MAAKRIAFLPRLALVPSAFFNIYITLARRIESVSQCQPEPDHQHPVILTEPEQGTREGEWKDPEKLSPCHAASGSSLENTFRYSP
jgi:hypothetical protein